MFILSNAGINNVAVDIIFSIVMILLTVAVLGVGIWLLVKFIGKGKDATPKGDKVFAKILALVLFCGIVLRLALALSIKGHRGDFDDIAGAMDYMAANGFAGYYTANGITLYPLSLLIYSLFGVIANAIGINSASYAMVIFVKLPLIIADIVSAVFIYKLAAKYVNGYVALTICGIFMLMPVFLMSSAVWGSLYSLLTLGLVLCMYFMANKNYLGLFASYSASLLIMKDALYLFPLFAVFIIYSFIKALRKVVTEKIPARNIWSDKEACATIRIPVYLVASVIISYLIALPTILGNFGASFFGWIYRFSLAPLAAATSFGTNSLGIFNIFARNGDELGANFPTIIFAVIFAVIILGIVLLIYLSKKNRANLVFLAAYILLTLATYYVDFSALSLVPAVAILLAAFVLIKDKRILQVFGVLSLLIVVNSVAVLVSAGYINVASDYMFENVFYTGTDMLNVGGGLAVSIICSVFAVLTHLYSTVILLDMSMSNKRKLLPYSEKISLPGSIALWIKP